MSTVTIGLRLRPARRRPGKPADYSYGERQYSVLDPAGHLWTFTQSVADVTPETWGGETVSAW